jgi:hypothetical protein
LGKGGKGSASYQLGSSKISLSRNVNQGREFIAIGNLENGAFCTVFSENFHKF